jgi:hypothetical protein
MALPKIDTPIYDLELPLCKKKIKFRPFLVKEQRNLFMALESGDKDSIESAIQQVLKNCTITKGVKIEDLPVLDIEFYFINLRARSVGEMVENKYRCDNEVEGKACGNIMETSLNLLDIKVEKPKDISDVIQLTDNISVKLRYPKFSVLGKLANLETPTEVAFEMIADSVEYICDGEQFYYEKDVPHKEIVEFIETLSQKHFSKIEEFFANLPKLEKKIEMKCSRCGFQHTIDIEGLESFFG